MYKILKRRTLLLLLVCTALSVLLTAAVGAAETTREVVTLTNGTVRVQLLSDALIRVEEKNANGFEDRSTLVAVGRRNFVGVIATVTSNDSYYLAKATKYTVKLYKNKTVAGGAVVVTDPSGKLLWKYGGDVPTNGFHSMLPPPRTTPDVYALADSPRIIPPAKGAAYVGSTDAYSGYVRSDGTDIYLFTAFGDAKLLRTAFVKLTGRSPVSDIKTFGSWYSRYQNWTEADYKSVISGYKTNDFPLDVLVVDTTWRAGEDGTGYDINTGNFPNMTNFISYVHKQGLLTIFNDHTHSTSNSALSPTELRYHTENLQRFQKLGLDGWWYDRNWRYSLRSPYAEISPTTLGMVIYNDIMASYNGTRRTFLLANADWVRNGKLETGNYSVIGHRYGIQWSGDITSEALQLRRELTNMVSMSARGASPYISSDLGGFLRAPQQSQSMYVRWMQYGALSPIFRIHSTMEAGGEKYDKLPYDSRYNQRAQTTVRNYMKMRYNLLPLFYTLGHEAYKTGLPIARRLDFYYDTVSATTNTEYLLGDSLLVAPMWTAYGEGDDVVPASWFGDAGVKASYFNNTDATGTAAYTQTAKKIDFDWGDNSPNSAVRSDNFTAVFTGKITPTEDCYIGAVADDAAKIYINGKQVVDGWSGGWLVSKMDLEHVLKKGTTYNIKVVYRDDTGGAVCRLVYEHITDKGKTARDVYLPSAGWINLFDGTKSTKAGTVRVAYDITKSPIYAKVGAIIPAVKAVSPIESADFEALSLNVFDGGNGSYTLYEDDGTTTAYKSGTTRTTKFAHTTKGKTGTLKIAAATGKFTTSYTSRAYTVRIHSNIPIKYAKLDGKSMAAKKIKKSASAFPLRETGAAPDSDVYEISFSASMSAAHTLTWQTMVAGSGDADGNGKVDTRDALLALRAVLDAKAASTLPEADVSGDDKLTLADVLLLLKQISAGK